MKSLRRITSVAAALPDADIDTDVIFPARFLVMLDKKGLGRCAFREWRKAAPPDAPFVLDAPRYKNAEILVTGPKFGVGSSREHAVWALADLGIRCVIAPSFGEIFFSNCFKNGLLPVVLNETDHARVMAAAEAGEPVTVDLEAEHVMLADGGRIGFSIEPYRRQMLLSGLDEIGAILADKSGAIAAFEARQRDAAPWLYLSDNQLSVFDNPETKESA